MFIFYLEVGLETPKKEQEKVYEKTSFQIRDVPVKRTENGRDEENQQRLLPGLQCNAPASIVHFVVYKMN